MLPQWASATTHSSIQHIRRIVAAVFAPFDGVKGDKGTEDLRPGCKRVLSETANTNSTLLLRK